MSLLIDDVLLRSEMLSLTDADKYIVLFSYDVIPRSPLALEALQTPRPSSIRATAIEGDCCQMLL